MAKARQLITGASYNPQELKVMMKAFDDAWASIAQDYRSSLAVQAARLKLANIVLNLAGEGVRDAADLMDRSVRVMRIDKP